MFRIMKWSLAVGVVYLVVFWNSYGTAGNIAQSIPILLLIGLLIFLIMLKLVKR